jgi:two-component system sensor histidine kinase KdpD
MRAHAIQGPWEASERVLVCVSDRPGGAALVRYARRLADRLRASWTAIYVETSRTQRLTEEQRDRVAASLRLAEQLGGQSVTIPAAATADGVIDYAHANNFTHIVVSTRQRSRWFELLRSSLAHEVIRRAEDVSVHVVPERHVENADDDSPMAKPRPHTLRRLDFGAYGGSTVMVAVALLVGLALQRTLGLSNIALVFLTAVLASAVTYGLWPALFASFVSVLAYNFFFLPPLYTFTIADPENVLALIVFAIIAVIASNLTGRVRLQALAARRRAKMTEDLYLFSRKLAGVAQLDDLLWATAHQIAQMLNVRVVLLLPIGETIEVRAGFPPEDMIDDADLAAAKWTWQHAQAAGRGADTLPGAKRLFLPMKTGRGTVGVIGLDSDSMGPILSPDQRRLLDALSDQAALAVERINLVADVDRTRLVAETERLRNALLTSISHDLRTPLASILGSATSLRTYRKSLDEKSQDELAAAIQEEAERLNRFISNLLDMTRLESGAVQSRNEMVDVGDVVGSALRRATSILLQHKIQLNIDAGLPMAQGDPVLLEQVLFNLLDNAAKYTPAGTTITLVAHADEGRLELQVSDEGAGLPNDARERVFAKFYRVHAGDSQRAGTGLGLAICRGFVEAMGGTITAANRTGGKGAVFTIVLPAANPTPTLAETSS